MPKAMPRGRAARGAPRTRWLQFGFMGCAFGWRRHRSSGTATSATSPARSVAPCRRGAMASRPVVGVDLHVVDAQVAGPDRGLARTTMQRDAHRDLALLHDALAVFLAVRGAPPAAFDDVNGVEKEIDPGLVEVFDARVAHGGEDAAEVRVAGEERRLDERRMGDGIGHQAALGHAPSALDAHGDKLGRAFA